MKKIIGITGTIASGKDYVGEYISKKLDIPIFQISQPIIEAVQKAGIPITRKNITEFAPKFAEEVGADYSARVHLANIANQGIITGMRQIAQIHYLRENSDLTLIAIDADPKLRFQRTQSRNRFPEATTLDQFIQDEKDENSGYHIQRVFDCMKLADHTVYNNLTLEDLHNQIDLLLKIK